MASHLLSPLRLTSALVAFTLTAFTGFAVLEAPTASAVSTSDEVTVDLTVTAAISINSPADISLGSIAGSGSASNSVQWRVITNNTAGYKFEINSSLNPAMQCSGGGCAVLSDTIANYTPAAAQVPETWSVAASAAEFGMTASGTDASTTFDNGAKYLDLPSTVRWIGGRTSQTTGVSTTVTFKAEIGASAVVPTGTYRATTTATVTTL